MLVDLEYSKTPHGLQRSISFYTPEAKVTLMFFRYESDPVKQKANRTASEIANPISVPDRTYDRHEVPYASTKEGGRYSIRRPVNGSRNKSHGGLLTSFYKDTKLQDGDFFIVPLYELIRPPSPYPLQSPAPEFEFKPIYGPIALPRLNPANIPQPQRSASPSPFKMNPLRALNPAVYMINTFIQSSLLMIELNNTEDFAAPRGL